MAHASKAHSETAGFARHVYETAGGPQRAHLFGQTGELVELRIAVDSRSLEDLLEALASLDFPVNPRLFHIPGLVRVEFPAYTDHIDAVRNVLQEAGFDENNVEVLGMLDYEAASTSDR